MLDRKQPYYVECFASYLESLKDDQSSIYKRKRPRQETPNQQMDLLDAMFTYLSIHADWKGDDSRSYLIALRAQKQFCSTLKEIKNLKFPKAPAPVLASRPDISIRNKIMRQRRGCIWTDEERKKQAERIRIQKNYIDTLRLILKFDLFDDGVEIKNTSNELNKNPIK